MPVERFRDVGDMPACPVPTTGEQLIRAIAATWERAHIRGGPPIPRGVRRFRSLAEAQAEREHHLFEHVQSLRRNTKQAG